jgi:hypothetical protein
VTTKSLGRFEVKDADKGQVSALFSTLGVVDLDGDVTKAGAFEDGAEVVISAYGHKSWHGALPVGKGVIHATDSEAVMKGQFFMDTQHGADTFRTVKALASSGLGEWSYGYDATQFSFGEFDGRQVRFLERLKVHEVSPVLQGAGVGTGTLSVKGAPMSFREECEAVLTASKALADRAADVMAMRQEKGKGLGVESADLLRQVVAECKRLEGLLEVPDPEPVVEADLTREFLRFTQIATALG